MKDPNSQSPPRRHSEDVFEEEIEDLEKPAVGSWSTWLAGVGIFALLAGIVLAVMAWEATSRRDRNVAGNLPSIYLLEPAGTLDHIPTAFRWQAVNGASSYLVTVMEAKSERVMFSRPTQVPRLAAVAGDLGEFRPGSYKWMVEARGPDGRPRAWGEGDFTLTSME